MLCVLEEKSSTEGRSRSRMEKWVMDQDNNNTNISTTLGKVSIMRNIMRSDDFLIMVCPECLIPRVAASTKVHKTAFADKVTSMTENSMAGVVVASYCSLKNDQCVNTDTSTDMHMHKLLSDFESWSGCKTIGMILKPGDEPA
ncbi:hypothetical protein B0A55_10854 [Friedmanniomyces simplex]|uniref:Uncharacterized protein n=1 Tax=Friedmanniomyces simplex TaxID=329884 RepID=A0A4U0X2E3_9PEZI|nr:hypothetical protein B0A55_10854 [Friedmanniomyces simplex]